MKPVLYIGAALMIGAGIYGFVDYNKKSHSKKFQNLYTKEAKQEEANQEEVPPPAPTGIPEIMAADIPALVKDTIADTQPATVPPKKATKKKHKKLGVRLYSRAALDEEMITEVPLVVDTTVKAIQ